MPVRVELIDEAVEDLIRVTAHLPATAAPISGVARSKPYRQGEQLLIRYAETGNLALFLKKLIRLEEVGKDAGLPLGRGLTGWRKIVVSDRNWRIIFTTYPQEAVATVCVIGDRDDAACYEAAQRRVRAFGKAHPQAASLAAAMFQLSQIQKAARRRKRRG